MGSSRSRVATLLLACAALVPACLIDGGPLPDEGTGGAAAGGGTGLTGAGGAGGTGGTGGSPGFCGDGKVDGGEQCDDENALDGDGCTAGCEREPGYSCVGEPSVCDLTCGNGEKDAGEECDDGGIDDGDGCSPGCLEEAGYDCTGEPSVCDLACGDGDIDDGEECDDGGVTAGDGCSVICDMETGWTCDNEPPPSSCEPACGDGIIIVGFEVCDDGDPDPDSGCNATCTAVNDGWTCDDMTGGLSSCSPICGDWKVVSAEECDDGNTENYDGCDGNCEAEHECGNGIVDPTEQCDGDLTGGNQCQATCMLDPGSVCANAIAIPPGMEAPGTGVITSFHEHVNSEMVDVGLLEVASQSCDMTFNNPVLHRYRTGKRPSIVTVESLDKMLDNSMTFDNTLVWIYRDCPKKADLEGCDNDGAPDGKHSKMTTGYLPANTTIFIVLAGEGMNGDKGKYRLQVTEQPVKLFFHEDFGPEKTSGLHPLPADLTEEPDVAGGWETCVNIGGSPCFSVTSPFESHSGGALGWGSSGADMTLTHSILHTPSFDLSALGVARGQYSFRFIEAAGADFGMVQSIDDGVVAFTATHNQPSSGRTFVQMPLSPVASLDFTYDDAANIGAGTFSIDDIYIFGY